jgi:hypothetical protein
MEVSSPLEGRALRELGRLLREERAQSIGLKKTILHALSVTPKQTETSARTSLAIVAACGAEEQASYGYDAW